MAISFMRIDDRLIHGEVVTRWLNEFPCDGIIAVDDKAAKDPIISKVLKGAVPASLRSFVMPSDRVIKRWNDIVGSTRKYFMVSRSPLVFQKLYENGCDFTKEVSLLNVGPMSERSNAKKVGPNANITKEELEAFNLLNKNGMNIEFQLIPDSQLTTLEVVNKRFTE